MRGCSQPRKEAIEPGTYCSQSSSQLSVNQQSVNQHSISSPSSFLSIHTVYLTPASAGKYNEGSTTVLGLVDAVTTRVDLIQGLLFSETNVVFSI